MSDTLTHEEGEQAAAVLIRLQPYMWLIANQFTDEELDILEKGMDEIWENMRGRHTLAEVFGRSAFNDKDQAFLDKRPALKATIDMIRKTKQVPTTSRVTYHGQAFFEGEM